MSCKRVVQACRARAFTFSIKFLWRVTYDYLNSYPSPRIIVHGKDYDRTYRFHYKEPKVDVNRYNLNLEEMDKKVKEIARRYLDDGYGSIDLLGLFK